MNARHLAARGDDSELSARIQAYELAYRMQSAAPEAVDLSAETEETRRLYGLDRPETAEFGTRCLLARRLVERGVRFVQLYSGDVNGWDAHDDVEANHARDVRRTDQPVAGLLKDLRRRGLLDETLVIWGGEFGRMPMSESGRGRDHNPHGFTTWLAGAGIKGGTIHGATDAVGLRAAVEPRPRPRFARHDPPPAGPRPHPPDLPPQRPRRPPHRHRRHGRPRDPESSARSSFVYPDLAVDRLLPDDDRRESNPVRKRSGDHGAATSSITTLPAHDPNFPKPRGLLPVPPEVTEDVARTDARLVRELGIR